VHFYHFSLQGKYKQLLFKALTLPLPEMDDVAFAWLNKQNKYSA